ncbi:MAG: hypothetical protein IE937_01155 [Gammaproteobacteria bacterium]|nr:hypothetical protein [Gammaproteobacteria bacterium]
MLYIHPETGKPLSSSSAFTLNGVKYPATWLTSLSTDQAAAMGFTVYDPPAEDPAVTLANWRDNAVISKAQFCLRANAAGLLTDDEMVLSASGGWPTAFADAFASLPVIISEAQAKAVWAAVAEVYRNDPVLNAVATAKGIAPETLDSIFGWTGQQQ